jgi:predicted amidophosphoribosyltransferase
MDAADWVSIPLSAHRLRERGFNQALLLARIWRPPDRRHTAAARMTHRPKATWAARSACAICRAHWR